MPSHIVRVLCEARSQSRTVRDSATGETPFAWRGSDLTFQLGLTDNAQHLLAADVGQIIVEVKALDATSADDCLMRKEFAAADCDPTFEAADWLGGSKQLLAATFTKAEAALPPNSYRFIVRHIAPDDSEMTYISAEFRLLDPQSGSDGLEGPPVAWSFLEGLPVIRPDIVQTLTSGQKKQARENIGIDATSYALGFLAAASDAAAARALLGAAAPSGSFETWVIEGDSWSQNLPGNDRNTWSHYIASLIGPRVNIVNAATQGETAQTMVGQFATQCAPYLTATTGKPSTCFIFAGINDGGSHDTAAFRTNIRALWTAARTAGARVIAFTLPYRSAGGGWTQAEWATVNSNIRADSVYWDILIETDVFHNNASSDTSDNLHIATGTHRKFAGRIMGSLAGGQMWPSLPSDLVCSSVGAVNFSGATGGRRNIPFSEKYDANNDATNITYGGDTATVFTAPVSGTYEISASLLLGGMAAGNTAYLSAYIVFSGASELEHRMDYQISPGSNMTLKGTIRRRLYRGDTVVIAVTASNTATTILQNAEFGTYQVRLVSIP